MSKDDRMSTNDLGSLYLNNTGKEGYKGDFQFGVTYTNDLDQIEEKVLAAFKKKFGISLSGDSFISATWKKAFMEKPEDNFLIITRKCVFSSKGQQIMCRNIASIDTSNGLKLVTNAGQKEDVILAYNDIKPTLLRDLNRMLLE